MLQRQPLFAVKFAPPDIHGDRLRLSLGSAQRLEDLRGQHARASPIIREEFENLFLRPTVV